MEPASIEASTPPDVPDEIIARAGRYYRWTRYIISVGLLIGWGSLAVKDGFFVWPAELEKAKKLEESGSHAEVKPHSETDIRFQQVLGLTMPPLGLALLIWTLYNSRGQYRLSGHTLYVPGHPPVPLESIVKLDETLWAKKGIAWIEYALPAGEGPADPALESRELKLDDFVYERAPTDAIVERIKQIIAPELGEEPAADTSHQEASAVDEGGGVEE